MTEAPLRSVAVFDRGPAWLEGQTSREQPWWDEHAAFIDGLEADGVLLLAGPFADWTGALLVLEGDPAAIERRLDGDPFVVHGVFSAPVVRPWLIWVDRGGRGSA